MTNAEALAKIKTAISDAAAALRDLAAKATAGQDISVELSAAADGLEAVVAEVGEPVTPPAA